VREKKNVYWNAGIQGFLFPAYAPVHTFGRDDTFGLSLRK